MAELAGELVQSKPDVIFALGGDVAPFAKRATQAVPSVVMTSADPIKGGLVASLARPGGNVTGVTLLSADLAAKRIQFLKEIITTISRVGVIWNPDHADDELPRSSSDGSARKLARMRWGKPTAVGNRRVGQILRSSRSSGRRPFGGSTPPSRTAFTDFDQIDNIVSRASRAVGFALPLKENEFVVVRFNLQGAAPAIAVMRATAERQLKPATRGTRDQRV